MTSAFSLILQNEYFPQNVRQQITDLSWPLKMEGVSYPRSNEIREMLYSHYTQSASLTIIYQFLYTNTMHPEVQIQMHRKHAIKRVYQQ